jgi:hypothetical protein
MWTWFSLGVLCEDAPEFVYAPKGLTWEEAWGWLEDMLDSPGSNGCRVDMGMGYAKQCSLGFSAKEIKTISDAGALFSITCYQEEKEREEDEVRSRAWGS